MPLCAYFINGNCRFGSKCVNDHIDIKTLLKSESEAVLNGKQWLLSCFGPFKESVVVPNFIPDQSFEEIRMGFMENSKNGNVQNYINNLMSEYNNALRKMNELKAPSNETLQLIASIYNTSNSNDQKPKTSQPQAPNPFQSSNIFGGTTQQQTMPSASIFGTSTTQNNPFQQQTAAQQPTSSMFGSSTNNNAQSFSFNQASQEQKPSVFAQSSIFSSAQNQAQPNASVFSNNPAQPNASVFSNNQSQNIFAQQANTFAMPSAQTGTSVFGSAAVQQPSQSVFGSTAMQQPSQNIFAVAAQQPGQNVFATAPQQPIQSTFGATNMQQNVFGATANIEQPAQNIFGAATAQQPAQSVFGTAASNQQNVFGSFSQNQPPAQTSSIFGSSQPQQQGGNMSTNVFNSQPASMQPQPAQTSQIFGGNPFQQVATFNDEHFYSKDEELSPEQIQAYQAEVFIPGKIPVLPPTKTLSYT